jgi:uncharacterized peroxidase-related enzyme
MPRFHQTHADGATGAVADLYTAVTAKFGKVPNGIQILGTSEESLRGYLGFAAAASRGKLRGAERERIAIAVATFNGCEYCLAGHTAAAAGFNVDEADRRAAQHFRSSDARSDAILAFTRAVLEARGAVSDVHLAQARDAGLTDAELIEIIAEVALNVFTNYAYRAAGPELDFPAVEAAPRAA